MGRCFLVLRGIIWGLKENFTLIYEIWLLLINYNVLKLYDLLFLKYQKIEIVLEISMFPHAETCFYTFFG